MLPSTMEPTEQPGHRNREYVELVLRTTFGQNFLAASPQLQRLIQAHALPRNSATVQLPHTPSLPKRTPNSAHLLTGTAAPLQLPPTSSAALNLPSSFDTPGQALPSTEPSTNARRISFSPSLVPRRAPKSHPSGLALPTRHSPSSEAVVLLDAYELQGSGPRCIASTTVSTVPSNSTPPARSFDDGPLSPSHLEGGTAFAKRDGQQSGKLSRSSTPRDNSASASLSTTTVTSLARAMPIPTEIDATPADLALPATLRTSTSTLSSVFSVQSATGDASSSGFRTLSTGAPHPAGENGVLSPINAPLSPPADARLPSCLVPTSLLVQRPAILSPVEAFQASLRNAAGPRRTGIHTVRVAFAGELPDDAEGASGPGGASPAPVVRIIEQEDGPMPSPLRRVARSGTAASTTEANESSATSLSDRSVRTQAFPGSFGPGSHDDMGHNASATYRNASHTASVHCGADTPDEKGGSTSLTTDAPDTDADAEQGVKAVSHANGGTSEADPPLHRWSRAGFGTGAPELPSHHASLRDESLVPGLASFHNFSSSVAPTSCTSPTSADRFVTVGSVPNRSLKATNPSEGTASHSYSTGASTATGQSLHSLPPHEIFQTQSVRKTKDATGKRYINGYQVLSTLGVGTCGKVRLAFDNKEKRLVAIKEVKRANNRQRIGGPTEAQQRYLSVLREIEVMTTLRHKNIVSVYEVINDPNADSVYIVMQHVNSGAIASINVVEGSDRVCEPLPPQRLVRAARQMLAGLDYLHRKNVVHRDIKPDNILVDNEGHVYLADFGVAENFDTQHRERLERAMQASMAQSLAMSVTGGAFGSGPKVLGTKGTPLFIAPELYDGQRSYGKPVDMWALGVTLFTLLTGRLPFHSPMEVSDPSLPVFPDAYGPAWVALLRGMLERDPKRRLTAAKARQMVKAMVRDEVHNEAVSSASITIATPERAVSPTPSCRPAFEKRAVAVPDLSPSTAPAAHPPPTPRPPTSPTPPQRGRRRTALIRRTPAASPSPDTVASDGSSPELATTTAVAVHHALTSSCDSIVLSDGDATTSPGRGGEGGACSSPLPEDDERQCPLVALHSYADSVLPSRAQELGLGRCVPSASASTHPNAFSTTVAYRSLASRTSSVAPPPTVITVPAEHRSQSGSRSPSPEE